MIRFALIGFGAIGRLRAEALQQTTGAQLRWVVEPVAERREEAVRQFGARTVAHIDDLAGVTDVDAVIVSTPPNLHLAQCEAALRQGKHVLCEKPLAPTVAECRRIVDTAREQGKVLATGFNYRFYPAVVKARELIAAGRIGEVDHVLSVAGHPGGPEFTHPWVHDPTIVGGGALMDNGIHAADLTLYFLGEAAESYGLASNQVWRFPGSEDNGYALLRTAQGRVGMLHASWTQWKGYRFQVEIHGTHGAIHLSYPPMLTILYDRPKGAAKRGRRHFFAFPVFQVQERLRSYRWTVVQSFVAEQLDFMRRVAGGVGIGATGIDGLRAVELVHSAYARAAHNTASGDALPVASGAAA